MFPLFQNRSRNLIKSKPLNLISHKYDEIDEDISGIIKKTQKLNNFDSKFDLKIRETLSYLSSVFDIKEGFFMIAFSLIATITLTCMEFVSNLIINFKVTVLKNNFLFSIIINLTLGLISIAIFFISKKELKLNGIPGLKAVLFGLKIEGYFSSYLILLKFMVFILMDSSFLLLGKIGTYIHISSLICKLLMKLPFFKKFNIDDSNNNSYLLTASTIGAINFFMLPFTSLFFALEITFVTYSVVYLWKNIVVAVLCYAFKYSILNIFKISSQTILLEKKEDSNRVSAWNYVLYILFGILIGLLSSLINNMILYLNKKINIFLTDFEEKKKKLFYLKLIIVTIIMSTSLIFPLKFLKFGFNNFSLNKVLLRNETYHNHFYKIKSLESFGSSNLGNFTNNEINYDTLKDYYNQNLSLSDFNESNSNIVKDKDNNNTSSHNPIFYNELIANESFWNIFLSALIVIVVILLISFNEIMVDFIDSYLILGALFGVLFSRFLRIFMSNNSDSFYAMLGMSAFSSSGLHSISLAIMSFEITGEVDYILPLILTSTISIYTNKSLSNSLYKILSFKSYLPNIDLINDKYRVNSIELNDLLEEVNPFLIMNYKQYEIFINENQNFYNDKIEMDNKEKENLNEKSSITYSKLLEIITISSGLKISLPILSPNRNICFTITNRNLILFIKSQLEHSKIKQNQFLINFYEYCLLLLNIKKSNICNWILSLCNWIYKRDNDKYEMNLSKKYEELLVDSDNKKLLEEDFDFKKLLTFAEYNSIQVEYTFTISKVIKLFKSLNLNQIFIVRDGKFLGIILKDRFYSKLLKLLEENVS